MGNWGYDPSRVTSWRFDSTHLNKYQSNWKILAQLEVKIFKKMKPPPSKGSTAGWAVLSMNFSHNHGGTDTFSTCMIEEGTLSQKNIFWKFRWIPLLLHNHGSSDKLPLNWSEIPNLGDSQIFHWTMRCAGKWKSQQIIFGKFADWVQQAPLLVLDIPPANLPTAPSLSVIQIDRPFFLPQGRHL